MNDYYEILGLQDTATQQEIKTAYRRLALKFHPDKNKNTGDKFRKINEAYTVLKDERARLNYDKGLTADWLPEFTEFFDSCFTVLL